MRERYGFELRSLRKTYDDGAFRFYGGYAIYDRRCGGPDPVAYALDAALAQKIVDVLNNGTVSTVDRND